MSFIHGGEEVSIQLSPPTYGSGKPEMGIGAGLDCVAVIPTDGSRISRASATTIYAHTWRRTLGGSTDQTLHE